MKTADAVLFLVAVLGLAVVVALDLERVAAGTLTLYTTPALRDLLEEDVIPRYRESGGMRVEPVYTAAGEQYNRLRMSGEHPEADLFLQGSPLYIQRGFDEGYFLPINVTTPPTNETFRGPLAAGGWEWLVFAWTPVVEVYRADRIEPPDLRSAHLEFGLPHPRLSNNGVYVVLLFETEGSETGRAATERTVVQPINARTSISGVIDGSFDVTLGYESVTKFFQKMGADVRSSPPIFGDDPITTPALMTAGLVAGAREAEARRFIEFLFQPETQDRLADFDLRPINATPDELHDVFPDHPDVGVVTYDWTDVRTIEEAIERYEVTREEYW